MLAKLRSSRLGGAAAGLRGHHATLPAHWRGMLAGTGAIGLGVSLGVLIGLLTRPRGQQPDATMIYTEPRPDQASPDQTRATT
jgi:hypothetical protein